MLIYLLSHVDFIWPFRASVPPPFSPHPLLFIIVMDVHGWVAHSAPSMLLGTTHTHENPSTHSVALSSPFCSEETGSERGRDWYLGAQPWSRPPGLSSHLSFAVWPESVNRETLKGFTGEVTSDSQFRRISHSHQGNHIG